MPKKKISQKAIPILFDAVVYSGFAAFLFASYLACQTLLERFPGSVNKLIGMLHSFIA